jgi:hypothetical protein
MSADDTGVAQLERLRHCGYRVAVTSPLRDVDDALGAYDVASLVPRSRFAAAVAAALPIEGGPALASARVS